MGSFKGLLISRLGVALLTAGGLWALWVFGLADSLTAGLGSGAAKTLEVFVAIGITLLSLLWPVSGILQESSQLYKGIETELGKTERRYRNIVEATHDIILEINEAGNIVFANPAVKLLGYERDQLLGQALAELLDPAIREEALPRLTTRRIGPRATLNYPVTLLTDENSVLSAEIPSMRFVADASGLWKEPDEIVSTKGTTKNFLGTLFIARVQLDN